MARRGRPPYPGLLTPREVEVLALLREGLTNESIAERLGISLAGAKYHVSEILGKLGVETREEAALWSPEGGRPRPRWAGLVAPIGFAWRRASSGPVAAAGAATVALLIAAGAALLVWGLLRTGGTTNNEVDLRATPRALVEIGGKIDSISDQQLVLRDWRDTPCRFACGTRRARRHNSAPARTGLSLSAWS